jgi:non-heme chloroperoxidase
LFTQMLAGCGLSAAAVAIDPAQFRGVLPLPLATLRSALPVLGNPLNRGRAIALTLDQFKYGWANAVSDEEAKQLHETYHVPGAGQAALPGGDGQPESVDRGQKWTARTLSAGRCC